MSLDRLTAFFDLVLPAAGWKCLFTLPDRRHHWFRNHRTMAEAALLLDQEGLTVYHGNAGFEAKKRTGAGAATVAAFRLDVDAGGGKPYLSAAGAYAALEMWRGAVGLPPALVVGSGGGLHAYWPLRNSLRPDEWGVLSARLQSLCAAHGLMVDTTVTCDAARILRPPFTHNRKAALSGEGGPVEVRLGPFVGPYDPEDLKPLFEGDEDGALFGLVSGPSEILRQDRTVPRLCSWDESSLGNFHAGEPDSDPDLIARECAQFRFAGEPAAGWYALVGVLAHCGEAGALYARRLATAPEWIPVIEQKLDQWKRKTTGPTTCERFSILAASNCAQCVHKGRITSPIQLGRPLPPAVTAPAPPVLELPNLPDPYHWRGMRLAFHDRTGKDGAPPYHIISDYPFAISELQEGERSGGVSAICRSWEPTKLAWREFPVALKEVMGDRGAAMLAHYAVVVGKQRWPWLQQFLTAMVGHYRGTKQYGIRYEQFGWKTVDQQPAFVIGSDFLARETSARCFGSSELERRAPFLAARGSLAVWKRAVETTTMRPGMESHTFQGLCGFASILYHLTGAEGGTIVHSMSMKSGKGKTFGLKIAGSVWGDWFALRIKARDTEVAKFIALGILGHLPALYDELREIGVDAADRIKGFILQYTLGEDKARGAADGGLRSDALPWSNIMLSTANISLVDTCLSDGVETAQAARVYEFTQPDLPAGITTSFGADLEKEMAANAGHAGRAFVQACLERWEWVQAAVPAAMRKWEARLGGGPETRYTLRLLGAVSVAMVVLEQAGILRFDAVAMTAWMESVARENATRMAVESEPDPTGILSRMMNDLLANTLVMPGPVPRGTTVSTTFMPVHTPKGALLARFEQQGREYLVEIGAVRQWMQDHKYPMTELGRTLHKMGVIKDLRKRRTLGAGWIRTSQPWCWQIDGNHPAIAELWVESAPDNVVLFPQAGGKI